MSMQSIFPMQFGDVRIHGLNARTVVPYTSTDELTAILTRPYYCFKLNCEIGMFNLKMNVRGMCLYFTEV